MSGERTIATLAGKLKFDVDSSGLIKFEKMLDRVRAQMAALDKQASRLQRKLGASPKTSANIQRQIATQQKQTQQQFAQMLKTSKLQLANDTQQLKLQSVQTKASTLQARQAQAEHRATASRIKAEQAAQQFSLRQEQSRLKLQQERIRLTAAQSRLEATRQRTQAAADRARITALRLEERLSKALPKSLQPRPASSVHTPASGRSFGGSLSHVASAGLGGGLGASIPGLGMFNNALHPAAVGLGALAVSAALAQAKLNQLAKQDVTARDTRMVERANFRVATGSPEAAAQAEGRLTALANDLGIIREQIAKPYTMATVNLTEAGMTPQESATMLRGLMSFGRGAGVSTDDQAGALRAIQQSLSKGQLYSEEMRQQLAERLPGAWNAAAEAWARQTKSGLSGDKASLRFSEDMEDRKIAGKALVDFWKQFGQVLQERANAGGRLDEIRQSADASLARIENMRVERSIRTTEFNDSQLKKASAQLYIQQERFQKSLEKLIPGFSSLESASLKLEARFYETAAKIVTYIEAIQNKLDTLEPSPSLIKFVDAAERLLETVFTALEPVLDLISDVVSFIAELSFDGWLSSLDTFADAMNGLSNLLDDMPAAVKLATESLRNLIGAFFDRFGLGDKWREHQKANVENRKTAEQVSKISQAPFLSAQLNPQLASNLNSLVAPSPSLQNLIDQSTTNTNQVMQFSPSIVVNVTGSDAKQVVHELEARLQVMAKDATRAFFDGMMHTTATNMVQVRK